MSDLLPRPAFAAMTPVAADNPGVHVRLIAPSLVSVLARKDALPALQDAAMTAFQLTLQDAPVHGRAETFGALGLGPGRWMFVGAPLVQLDTAFGGLGSLSDHSDGYAVFEIWGTDSRRALAKGVPLDLELFGDDEAAATSIAHIGAILWKRDADRFVIAVFRSYAASFWHWLHASAAEFGLAVDNKEPS